MRATLVVVAIMATAVAGVAAYWGGRAVHHGGGGVVDGADEIRWMREEFRLSDAEFGKVEALHLAYIPRCDALCRKVEQTGRKVAGVAAEGSVMTAELVRAVEEDARVRAECRVALMEHLYETASAMPGEAGKRFLGMALPTVLSNPHPDVHDSVRR